MRVLAIKPMEIPVVCDIEKSLDGYYGLIGCDCIQAVYPFEDRVALVCDDEGKFYKMPNRALKTKDGRIYDIVYGTFFICGVGAEDFEDIPDDLAKKYMDMFFAPELYVKEAGRGVVRYVGGGKEPPMVISYDYR